MDVVSAISKRNSAPRSGNIRKCACCVCYLCHFLFPAFDSFLLRRLTLRFSKRHLPGGAHSISTAQKMIKASTFPLSPFSPSPSLFPLPHPPFPPLHLTPHFPQAQRSASQSTPQRNRHRDWGPYAPNCRCPRTRPSSTKRPSAC